MINDNLIRSLPIQAATRLTLGSISYSNPLPPWFEPRKVRYATRETAIIRKINGYLDKEKPRPVFQIGVPKRGGEKRTWRLPSVNDQIVVQVCVSALAEVVSGAVNRKQIFSYRYNTDKDKSLLAENASDLWKEFQSETERRLKGAHILQFDLENAFERIDRPQFMSFLDRLAPNRIEVSLLGRMLESFAIGSTGLPLLNDSIFFLGNAYLQVVDEIVGKHSANFIRFIDDYRLFGDSQSELETSFAEIGKELTKLGFKVNDAKTKLGSAEEYLEALAKNPSPQPTQSDGYMSTDVIEAVPSAELLRSLITDALEKPDDLLTEGFGRLSLGAVRLVRASKTSTPSEYRKIISQDHNCVQRALNLLETYLKSGNEIWRTIWLLYVLADMSPAETDLSLRKKELLDSAANKGSTPLVRLWAKKISKGGRDPKREEIEELHEFGYLECGERLWNK